MNDSTEASRLIAEHERLRNRVCKLFQEWNKIDQRLVEIECELPDEYVFPGDPTEECSLPD